MLAAALVLAIADVVHTGAGALAILGLWALYAIPAALVLGVVLGAGNAQWGPGWIRRFFAALRRDPELDRSVTAGMIAVGVLLGALAIVVAILALGFVGAVQRKSIGALIHGGAVIAALPVFALLAIPAYRAARFANQVPLVWFVAPALAVVGLVYWKLGLKPAVIAAGLAVALRVQPVKGYSRVVILIVATTFAGLAFALRTIRGLDLDWAALRLETIVVPALLPVVALALALVVYALPPVARLRERIPRRGTAVAVAAAIALALPIAGLLPKPANAARDAVMQSSYLGARTIPILRALIDGDGDNESAFFGGPDCDDGNPNVHRNAEEIPGNGIDDNCLGGDGKLDATAGTQPPPPPPDAGAGGPAPQISGGKNVLVIFVDTLRYDRLGIAGYQRDGKSLTPNLDAFAKDAVVFSNAYAQAPNTPRSVPSFLASRYPSQLVVDRKTRDYPRIDESNELLFEVLAPAGFKTIGMTSHFYFCDRTRDPSMCPDVVKWMNSNVLQGASEWDNAGALNIPESNKDIAGPRTVKKTVARLDELAKSGDKFAMLVHLFEPHSTYVTHEGYPITTRGDASLEQKYDYEIAVCDKFIGEILAHLDKTGLAKDTTVVIISDHGEAFGVHKFAGGRMFFHGQTLYRELLHVPLMFRVPGVKGRIADDVVELIDMAPTVAALFGITPPASWRGRSLVPALAGQPLPEKPAYAELLPADAWKHDAKSMITGDGKKHVFYRISDGAWEIYDLEADPEERKNIAATDPQAQELQQALASWIEGALAKGAPK